jgi:hypothetical protein
MELEAVAQRLEPSLQPRDAHEGTTPLPRIRRRGGEDGDAQSYFPLKMGFRFSVNARVPSA